MCAVTDLHPQFKGLHMGVKVCLPGKTIPMNVAVVFAVLLLFHNVTKDGSAKKTHLDLIGLAICFIFGLLLVLKYLRT